MKGFGLALLIISLITVSVCAETPEFEYVGAIGTGVAGPGNDQLYYPTDIFVDTTGKVYVADHFNHRVQIFDHDYHYLATLGTTGVLGIENDKFHYPTTVFVDPDDNIYVSEKMNHRVQIFNSSLEYQSTLGSTNVSGNGIGQFNQPVKTFMDSTGRLYVVDGANNRVQIFDDALEYSASLSGFWWPWGISIDSSGKVYVSSGHSHIVKIFDQDRQQIGTLGTGEAGSGNDQFHYTCGVAVDPGGRIFVSDITNKRVQIFDKDLTYLATLGLPEQGENFQFEYPAGLSIDSKERIFITDYSRHQIKIFRMKTSLLDLSFDDTLAGANGETPTTFTGVEYADGVSGKGVTLEGSDKLHYSPQGNIDLTAGTVELWVKPLWNEATARDDHRFLLAATEEYQKNELRLYRRGGEGLHIIQFTLMDGNGVAATVAGSIDRWKVDEWHHVAATWNVRTSSSGEMHIYIDGAHTEGKTGLSLSMGDPVLPLRIGAEYLDRFQPNAVIDELRILNYPLSADEVQARYTEMQPIPTPTTTITTTPTENDWPMRGHDLLHTGTTSSGPGVDLELAWIFDAEGDIYPSPAVASGLLFVGSHSKNIYAVNASTGKEVWRYAAGDIFVSSPAVAGDTVFIGSHGGYVYAVDAMSGELSWRYKTNGIVDSSPAVADGAVVIGSYDKSIYALDAKTGDLLWNYSTGDKVMASSPIVFEGMVYIGSVDDQLHAINASTGVREWTFGTGGDVYSSPVVKEGTVYIGSRDGKVYALRASDGGKLWEHTTGDDVVSSPAVTDGAVFIGSKDRNVYALDPGTGEVIWKTDIGAGVFSTCAVSDSVVYVGSYDTHVYALDASTGGVLWRFKTSCSMRTKDCGIYSSPAVAGGHLYVSGINGNVYAFRAKEATVSTTTVQPEDLFVDDFNDGDDVGWKPVFGSWIVEDGAYKSDIDTSMSIDMAFRTLAEQMIARNAIVTVKVMLNSSGCNISPHLTAEGGPLLGMMDDNNGYGVKIQSSGGITIVKIKDGSIAYPEGLIGNKGKHMICEEWYNVKFMVNETKLKAKAWKDGTEEPTKWDVEINDTEFNGTGMVGLFQSRGGPIYFDDMNVTDLDLIGASSPAPTPEPAPTIPPTTTTDLAEARLLPPVTVDATPCSHENMARVTAYWGSYCIDRYEAYDNGGKAGSASGKEPWVNINWNDTKAACSAAGKRLCKDFEWMAACNLDGQKYFLTEEEDDETYSCNTFNKCSGVPCVTGFNTKCKSDAGVYDMIGNVLEVTDAQVPSETWAGSTAYIGDILSEANDKYGDDRLTTLASGVNGNVFLRGGYFHGQVEHSPWRGCFELRINYGPLDSYHRHGFRCCSSETDPPDIRYAILEDALVDMNQLFLDHVRAGNDHTIAGEYDDAIAAYDAALAIAPDHPNALADKAVALGYNGNVTGAITLLDQVLTMNGTHKEALFNKGFFLVKQEEYEDAVTVYGTYLTHYPGDADASKNKQTAESALGVSPTTTVPVKTCSSPDNSTSCCADESTGLWDSALGCCDAGDAWCSGSRGWFCLQGQNVTLADATSAVCNCTSTGFWDASNQCCDATDAWCASNGAWYCSAGLNQTNPDASNSTCACLSSGAWDGTQKCCDTTDTWCAMNGTWSCAKGVKLRYNSSDDSATACGCASTGIWDNATSQCCDLNDTWCTDGWCCENGEKRTESDKSLELCGTMSTGLWDESMLCCDAVDSWCAANGTWFCLAGTNGTDADASRDACSCIATGLWTDESKCCDDDDDDWDTGAACCCNGALLEEKGRCDPDGDGREERICLEGRFAEMLPNGGVCFRSEECASGLCASGRCCERDGCTHHRWGICFEGTSLLSIGRDQYCCSTEDCAEVLICQGNLCVEEAEEPSPTQTAEATPTQAPTPLATPLPPVPATVVALNEDVAQLEKQVKSLYTQERIDKATYDRLLVSIEDVKSLADEGMPAKGFNKLSEVERQLNATMSMDLREGLDEVREWTEMIQALVAIALLLAAGLHFFKVRVFGEEKVAVMRGVEREGALIKVGIKVKNDSTFAIRDVTVTLEKPQALAFQSPHSKFYQLGDIEPGDFQSAIYKLYPVRCVSGKISGSVTYKDGKGQVKTSIINPAEVASICPMLEPYRITREQFQAMSGTFTRNEQEVRYTATAPAVFSTIKQRCGAMHPVIEVFAPSGQGEAWYAARGKYSRKAILLVAKIEMSKVILAVYAENPEMGTGLLAELAEEIERAGAAQQVTFQQPPADGYRGTGQQSWGQTPGRGGT